MEASLNALPDGHRSLAKMTGTYVPMRGAKPFGFDRNVSIRRQGDDVLIRIGRKWMALPVHLDEEGVEHKVPLLRARVRFSVAQEVLRVEGPGTRLQVELASLFG
jgi:hypothetical protein